MKLKLYLLFQSANSCWDTYDSCLVCAKNEEYAKMITPDGKFLASAGEDLRVKLWDLTTRGEPVVIAKDPYPHIVAFEPGGTWLAWGSGDGADLDGPGRERCSYRQECDGAGLSGHGTRIDRKGAAGSMRECRGRRRVG